MTNLIRFPGRRAPPPSPPTSVDVLLGELATVEIEFARARTAQIKSETNQSNVLWFWYCFKKVLFWGCVLWLLTTCAKAQPVGHNGSLMDMRVDNSTGEFSIVYAQPKPSLMAIGVSQACCSSRPDEPAGPFRVRRCKLSRTCMIVFAARCRTRGRPTRRTCHGSRRSRARGMGGHLHHCRVHLDAQFLPAF